MRYTSIQTVSLPPPNLSRLTPKFDVYLFPNRSLTWTVSLYHTCHNNRMICLLITTKTLFYLANADENGFLHIFSKENLLNPRTLSQSGVCMKERKRAVHMSPKLAGQVFFILHHNRCRFHALLNKTYIIYYWKYWFSKTCNRYSFLAYHSSIYSSFYLIETSLPVIK